jgi:hypothetical protein
MQTQYTRDLLLLLYQKTDATQVLTPAFLLMEDNVSLLLQEDNSSFFILEGTN